jgi:hypothetical protein
MDSVQEYVSPARKVVGMFSLAYLLPKKEKPTTARALVGFSKFKDRAADPDFLCQITGYSILNFLSNRKRAKIGGKERNFAENYGKGRKFFSVF